MIRKTCFLTLSFAFAALFSLIVSTPTQATPVVSGLQLWLDGSDPDGDTVVEGAGEAGISGATVTWADKSGNTRNFTQSTAARQPVYSATGFSNSTGAFDFAGSNAADVNGDTLFYGGTGPLTPGDDDYTYIAVWNADLHNQFRYLYTQGDGAGNGERAGLILSNTTYGFNGLFNDANGFVPSGAAQNNLTIMQADNNARFGIGGGPNIRIYDEGNLFTATTGNPAALNIQQGQTYVASSVGTGEFFDGKIAELIVYDRLLSAVEINQVGNYLQTKYALTWNDIVEPKYWDSNGATAGAGAAPNGTWGVDNFWNNDVAGGAGTFTTATTSTDTVTFSAGGDATGAYTVNVNGAQAAGKVVFEDGSVTLSGGSLTISSNLTHVTTGTTNISTPLTLTGTLEHYNGMLSLSSVSGTSGAWFVQNGGNQANGWLEVASGANVTAGSVSVTGSVSNTVMKLTGGTLATTGNFALGTNDGSSAGSNAFVYMSGGILNVGGLLHVRPLTNVANANDSAFFIMSGGTVNANGTETFLGSVNNGGQSTIVMSGGSFTSVGQVRLLPFQDAASFLVMGGSSTFTVNSALGIQLGGAGVQNRGPGQIYLSESSILTAQKIFKNSTTIPSISPSTVFFNGGTLKAGATNNTDFLGPALTPAGGNQALGDTGANYVRVFSGGATIDTQSFNVTANPAFLERAGGTTQQNVATISGINAGNAGANYAIAPGVGFSGGGGTGAAGYATLDGNGGIAAIVITDPGTGYTSAPTVTLSGGTLRTVGGVAASPAGWTVNLRSATAGGLTKLGAGTLVLANGGSTYTGPTTINNGTLSIGTLAVGGANSSIGKSSNAASNLVLNGGTLRYTGGAVNTDRLFSLGPSSGTLEANGSGAVNFTNTGAMGFTGPSVAHTLTLIGTNTGANTIAATIGDNVAATSVVKSGTGSWTLAGNNGYTGNTTVNQGTLALLNPANNNISGSPLITIASGAFLDTTGLGAGPLTSADLILASGQTIKGTGTIVGNMTVAANSRVAPGNSPGTLNHNGNETWLPAGKLQVEMNDAAGSAGGNPGWDLLAITGLLDLSGLSLGNSFEIELVSLTLGNTPGLAANFNSAAVGAWLITDTSSLIGTYTGTSQFVVNTGAFSNPLGGTFSVLRGDNTAVTSLIGGADNTQLYLYYAPQAAAVPEPGTLILAGLGSLGIVVLAARRRWKKA